MSSRREFYRNPETVDPDQHIIAVYYIESGTSLSKGAEEIAIGQSVGPIEIKTEYETPKIIEKHGGKIVGLYYTSQKEGIAEIAFPAENFNPEDGIPQLMTILAGNIYDIVDLRNVKLMDFKLPAWWARNFPGPKFGIEGTRKLIGGDAEGRPLIGTIVKPKIGLSPDLVAEVCYKAAVGGIDFIKDDEITANPSYCPIEERVTNVMEALDKAKEETGKQTLYGPCITSSTRRIFSQAEKAVQQGANSLMFNVLYGGFSVLRALAEDPSIKVPIYAHRGGDMAFTKNPRHGIDFEVLCKLSRLAGADMIHAGMIGGYINIPIQDQFRYVRALRDPYYDFKRVVAGISGGAHPGNVNLSVGFLGSDFMTLAGGGIMGHPQGITAGAKAMRIAVDNALQKIPIREVAKKHPEVKAAIDRWGVVESLQESQ